MSVHEADGRFTLLHNGEPYVIRGAGAIERLEELAALGANSVRTWGADENIGPLLDQAHNLGLTVTVGIWLKHEGQDGFSYRKPDDLDIQLEGARAAVRRWRDHPALLMWGIGNEMELAFDFHGDARLWDHVNSVARMVKEEDPNHPTMTVIAELGEPDGPKAAFLRTRLPDVDVLGINSYGGALTLPDRFHAAGLGKPLVVTEFGAFNHYELPKTAWGVAIEQTSTERADAVFTVYRTAIEPAVEQKLCLGSYWFYWGGQDKPIAGWHAAFAPGGAALGAVEVLGGAWSGRWPDNLAPRLVGMRADGETDGVAPGATFRVVAAAYDIQGDPLRYTWELRPERIAPELWGDHEPPTGSPLPDAIVPGPNGSVTVHAPPVAGAYRLYLRVDDGKAAATGNLPLRVGPATEK